MSEHLQPAPDRTSREREQSEQHEHTPGVFRESEAFDFRLILWVGVGLVVTCVVVQIVLWQFLGGLERQHAAPPGSVSELVQEDAERSLSERLDNVPGPHLEGIERESNSSSIAAARQQAEARMERYGWIDRQKEIVHVPIDKAMEQVLRSKEFGAAKRSRELKRPEMPGGKQ
ncbi:MAG TPA: hypothetical protein VMF69_20080 [Gemmataceae bacterium]|nr:hypothetical protein [Gemmataceae bacterium]